ncbi:MAG: hypothetical protein LWW96_05450 [Acidovorax sp.]|uniref:hypothetical protein n=1 Tax=Acidovorax sp. TaxID=1872122 RepID=UPI0025B87813|nr:hypothetical protein [Acidovorax sp.]MCE1191583.1 hypothetical protein [Acidovorax sp.]
MSAVALALAGRREARSAAAPLNAVSHWYWGPRALWRQGVDGKHTLAGYATHHGASVFWAALFAALLERRPALNTPQPLVYASAATAAVACFVDFQLTPKRLTPGFEHRLSRPALAATYLAFAAGLALGALATSPHRPHHPAARNGRPPTPLRQASPDE